MKISDLSGTELSARLRQGKLCIPVGPFSFRIESRIAEVIDGVGELYADYELLEHDFSDFHISLTRPHNLRRWFHPQVLFLFDGRTPFKPLPLSQAFPMLEWGMNWCIANHMHLYLILHAAVVEKDGQAVIMPGNPGAGKSTLCAALVNNGWRLFSDELAVLRINDSMLIPVTRPVSLKNESITIIKHFSPIACLGQSYADTNKGTVAHMRPPTLSVEQVTISARPRWIIAPRFQAEEKSKLEEKSKAGMFMNLAENAFNYHIHGPKGFDMLGQLVEHCDCYNYTYSDLHEAIETFEQLAKTVSDN